MAYNLRPSGPTPTGAVEFQVLEVEVVDDGRLPPPAGTEILGQAFSLSIPEEEDERPWPTACVVLVYGATRSGHTVLARVDGFRPSLVYEKPNLFLLQQHLRLDSLDSTRFWAKTLHGWMAEPRQYTRVYFPTVRHYYRARALNDAMEGRIDLAAQFCDQAGVSVSGWVRCGDATRPPRLSTCDVEVGLPMRSIAPLDEESIAPVLVASVDIECLSSTGGFPQATRAEDKVAMIGTSFWWTDRPADEQTVVVQCVGACDPVPGANVESYKTEKELLDAWRDLLVASGATVVTGWNTTGFDFAYMDARAAVCRCETFHYLGFLLYRREACRKHEITSNALGQNIMHMLSFSGRIGIDLFQEVKKGDKRSSYKLDDVAAEDLGEQKLPMGYGELNLLMRGANGVVDATSAADMAKAAAYNAQDALLVPKLLKKRESFVELVEVSRLTHTSIAQLVTRGQKIKVLNQLVWRSHRSGLVVNESPPELDKSFEGAVVIDPKVGIHNAPVVALDYASLYPSLILAYNLCFSNRVFVQCDATRWERVASRPEGGAELTDPRLRAALVGGGEVVRLPSPIVEAAECDFVRADDGAFFVAGVDLPTPCDTFSPRPGRRYHFAKGEQALLPALVQQGLAARKAIRKRMKQVSGSEYTRLDKAQLAQKISNNSIYGACPVYLAETVTERGRAMNYAAQDLARQFMPCEIVYGDTDSIFVKLPPGTLDDVYRIGEEMAAYITAHLPTASMKHGLLLEMDNLYWPIYLEKKKRYCAIEHIKKSTWVTKRKTMGMQSKRRDITPWMADAYEGIFDAILQWPPRAEGNDEAVRLFCETMCQQLIRGVPTDMFVETRSRKQRSEYANPEAVLAMAACDKMEAREPGSAPLSGDRVSFYISEGDPGTSVTDRVIDAEFGMKNGYLPDRLHALQKFTSASGVKTILQLCNCSASIFDPYIAELTRLQKKVGRIDDHLATSASTVPFALQFGGPPPSKVRKRRAR